VFSRHPVTFFILPLTMQDPPAAAQAIIDGAAALPDGTRPNSSTLWVQRFQRHREGDWQTRADAVSKKRFEAKMKKKDKVEFTLSTGAKADEDRTLQPLSTEALPRRRCRDSSRCDPQLSRLCRWCEATAKPVHVDRKPRWRSNRC